MSRSMHSDVPMTSVRLGYRIVEVAAPGQEPAISGVERARFYDVERAIEELRREVRRHSDRAPLLYLLAPNQEVIIGPDDFLTADR